MPLFGPNCRPRGPALLLLMTFPVIHGFGCIGSATSDGGAGTLANRQFPLEQLETTSISIGENTFHVWLATDSATREEGLMWVPEESLPDGQGMLFVFPDERWLGFWMKNTVTPLDIAYARMDGTIVSTHTMPALTLQTFPSYEPAMFALEVRAGTFERLGIAAGDVIQIPAEVFKP